MTAHEQFAQDLPLYAIGALPANESDALEAHLADCPVCRRELQQWRGDLSLVALSVEPAAPPRRSRQRLLDAIAKESHAIPASRSRWILVPFTASAILAIFVALLWRDNRALNARLLQSDSRQATQQASLVRAQHLLALMTDPAAMHVTLVAGKAKPQPYGRAVYASHNGTLVFIAANMPAPPTHKSYELWLVPVTGPPVAAGMFRPDRSGSATVMMPPLPRGLEAKAFAVTVEPEAGSPAPTMPLVLASGGE